MLVTAAAAQQQCRDEAAAAVLLLLPPGHIPARGSYACLVDAAFASFFCCAA